VKQVTSQRLALARAIGAEVFGTDGRLDIPATTTPTIEFPNRLKSATVQAFALASPETDTFAFNLSYLGLGAAGAGTQAGPFLTPGLWKLTGYASIQFTGTQTPGNEVAFRLNDPIGTIWTIARSRIYTPLQLVIPIALTLSITEPGWNFSLANPATVVGDALTVFVALLANRLL